MCFCLCNILKSKLHRASEHWFMLYLVENPIAKISYNPVCVISSLWIHKHSSRTAETEQNCNKVSYFTSSLQCITKTCPCNVYPLEPHFYIAKLGYAGVYLFFLFLFQNIDCGYSLETVLTCTHNLCFEQR